MKNKRQLNDLIEIQSNSISSDRLVTSSRTWLQVADVMSQYVATISPEEMVVSAAKVMSEKKISCLVIMDNGKMAGILTETDVLRRVDSRGKDFYQKKLGQIMSSPVESVPSNLSVLDASEIMGEKHIKRLPILDGEKLVGIVTQTDLVRALTSYGLWRDVSEIMSRDVAGVQSNASVAEAAKFMTSRNISCIVVLDGNEVVGVLTEKDLLGRVVALERDPACVKTEKVMSSPVRSIPPSYSIFSASKIMEEMSIRRLVVMKDKRMCGMVTQTDIFMAVRKKLQDEEERNLRLLEESKNNIYTTDLDGMITYVNPAFMRLLEVSEPQELIKQPFLPERFWLNLKEKKQFLRELKKGSIESKELTLKTSKGKNICVTVFPSFTKDIHGEINGSQGIVYDITDKKEFVALRETEEALQQSEERLNIILNSVLTGIVIIDADSHIIIDANPLAVELIGLPKEEIVGNLCHKFICPAEQGNCPISDLGQTVDQSERVLLRADGRETPIIKTVTPTTWQGRKYFVESFIDIAERKATEEALRQSEGKLDAMVRAIADDIALIDKDSNIIWANDVAKEIFGDDIIGKKCYEVYQRRNRPCEPYPCPTLQAFQDGKVHKYETQVTDKNGKIRYFHCIANVALRDEDGRPTGVLEICRDITERKRTEEALRESECKYSNLVQQSPDAVVSLDKTGNFLSFNPAAEHMSGFSAQEVLGRHFTRINILAEENTSKALKEFELILAGVERPPFELVITRKDKTRLSMEANGRLIKQKGQKICVQVTLRDITERKRAKDRLEKINSCLLSLGSDFVENANRITALLGELLGAAYTLYNRLDDGILFSLAQWHTPPDYKSQDKPDGHICYDLIQQDEDELYVVRDLQNSPYAHSDPNVVAYDLQTYVGQLVKCNGHHIGSLCAVFKKDFEPSDDEKKIIGILASAMRVEEERRDAEEELEKLNKDLGAANLELTRANKELQEFAYITAHDLKTPLRAICTLADWISADYADKFDEEGRNQVKLLVRRAKQMSRLIDDILQYSKLGQNGQKKQKFDLDTVLSELIAGVVPSENFEITIENELPTLISEKTQIIQVFQNLLSNAVKYMDKPKGQIKIGCVEQDGFWKFSVADNGPGIEEKHFDRIFKMFQTLSQRDGVESIGIGLSIVKKIVELNGGRVWVESKLGEGSIFFFTLPKEKSDTFCHVGACS